MDQRIDLAVSLSSVCCDTPQCKQANTWKHLLSSISLESSFIHCLLPHPFLVQETKSAKDPEEDPLTWYDHNPTWMILSQALYQLSWHQLNPTPLGIELVCNSIQHLMSGRCENSILTTTCSPIKEVWFERGLTWISVTHSACGSPESSVKMNLESGKESRVSITPTHLRAGAERRPLKSDLPTYGFSLIMPVGCVGVGLPDIQSWRVAKRTWREFW